MVQQSTVLISNIRTKNIFLKKINIRKQCTSFRGRQFHSGGDKDILVEQQQYYNYRAQEYDQWWERKGRFNRGSKADQDWHKEVEIADQFFKERFPNVIHNKRVLEIASGQ